jgi:hypothetical protein
VRGIVLAWKDRGRVDLVRLVAPAMARAAALKLVHPEAAASQPVLFALEFVPRASAAPIAA